MKNLLATLAICGLVASSASAQTTLPAEPETGVLAGCAAAGGGLAASLSAVNPGLGVLFMTFCIILVEDVRNQPSVSPAGEDR